MSAPATAKTEMAKPARLNALTGLRCFAALNIVFFHFSNPQWFGPFAPVVNAGYASVSFFILLSGFVLAYNYADKARDGKLNKVRFWEARFTRLYPIYLLSLLLAWEMVPLERAAHTTGMFWTGMVLTPVLLQGWIPQIATFLNTPAWTMSAESFFYFLFPWMARWKRPHAGGSAPGQDGWGMDAGADSRRALHGLQSRWHCASRSLELWAVAAGAQIHAPAASGQLRVWHPAGQPG